MKKNFWPWCAAVVAIIAGLILTINPSGAVKFIAMLCGLAVIANGVFNIITARKLCDTGSYTTTFYVKNIGSIVLGLLTVIIPLAVASAAWKVMVYIFAVFLVAAAALGFYSCTLLKKAGIERKRYIFENFGILLAGVLLFLISPDGLGKFIVRIIGIIVLVAGVVLLAVQIIALLNEKKNSVEVEAEVKDEPEAASDSTENQ